MADLRVASERARFGELFVLRGPGVRRRRARAAGPAGRPRAGRRAAVHRRGHRRRRGRAHRSGRSGRRPTTSSCPAAMELAGRIAANPPLAVQRLKAGLRRALDPDWDELGRVGVVDPGRALPHRRPPGGRRGPSSRSGRPGSPVADGGLCAPTATPPRCWPTGSAASARSTTSPTASRRTCSPRPRRPAGGRSLPIVTTLATWTSSPSTRPGRPTSTRRWRWPPKVTPSCSPTRSPTSGPSSRRTTWSTRRPGAVA